MFEDALEAGLRLLSTVEKNLKRIQEECRENQEKLAQIVKWVDRISISILETSVIERMDEIRKRKTYMDSKIYMIKKGDEVTQIFAKSVPKPRQGVLKVDNLKSELIVMGDLKEVLFYGNSEAFNLLAELDNFIVDVKTYSYRSYEPTMCFLVLRTETKLYVMDVMGFDVHLRGRNVILSEECARMVGLTGGLKVPKKSYDYRIRPLNSYLIEVIKHEMELLVQEYMEKGLPTYSEYVVDDLRDFKRSNGVPEVTLLPQDLVEKALKLRRFIAKTNNESISYVMTNKQLMLLLAERPLYEREFFNLLPRVSSLVREHVADFLRLFKEREAFSIEKLKERRDLNVLEGCAEDFVNFKNDVESGKIQSLKSATPKISKTETQKISKIETISAEEIKEKKASKKVDLKKMRWKNIFKKSRLGSSKKKRRAE